MKKNFSFLLVAFLCLLSRFAIAQDGNPHYFIDHIEKTFTLEELQDSTTNGVAKITIPDIRKTPITYQDLFYHVYVRFYYDNKDITKIALQEEVGIDYKLKVVGSSTFHDTANLLIHPYQHKNIQAFRFRKNKVGAQNIYDLTHVEVELDINQFQALDTLLLPSIYLEVYVEMGRYFTTPISNFIPKYQAYDVLDPNNQLKKQEAVLLLTDEPKPSSYEVEWVHVPHENPSSVNGIAVDFTKQGIRLQTDQNFVPVSMLYTSGFLIARSRVKRPVVNQDGTALLDKFFYSPWNLKEKLDNYSTSADNVLKIEHNASSPLVLNNWQYTASYANESKKKEVIQFYDGSNKSRQSNTLFNDFEKTTALNNTGLQINNQSTVLTGETYYDYNGKAVINTLPVPLLDADEIGFQTNLNTHNSSKLSKSDYDSAHYQLFPLMDKINPGAAQYYSDQNPWVGVDTIINYLPDAKGYPYQRLEFLEDGSGRVRTQYGLGEEKALDDTKVSRYAYAKPTTSELNRLFGTNVGLANFYKKNVTIDPNGVMSLAYIDNKGRTIASSIAGIPESRSKMAAIPSDSIYFNENLLATGAEKFNASRNSFELSYPIFVPEAADYTFQYGFDLEPYFACSNVNVCYDCRYELVFQILDDKNELFLEAKDSIVELSNGNCTQEDYALNLISYLENSTTATLTDSTILVNLSAQKQYTIIKKLSLLNDRLEIDAQHYLDSSACEFYDLEHFQIIELDQAGFEDCEMEFEKSNPCLEIEERLRSDFAYPNGAFVKLASTNDIITDFIYNELLKVVGCNKINDLSKEGFNNRFKSQFGLSMLPTFSNFEDRFIDFFLFFHPTYCQLTNCYKYNNPLSLKFDEILEKSSSVEEFEALAKKNKLMNQNDSLIFNGDTIITSTLQNKKGDLVLFNYDSTLRGLTNEGLFMSYDTPFNPYVNFDSLSYYELSFISQTRSCYLDGTNPSTANFITSYFTNYISLCGEDTSMNPKGISKISKLTSDNEGGIWRTYKTLFQISKKALIEDLINSIVCFGENDFYTPSSCHFSGSYHYPWRGETEANNYRSYDFFVGTGGSFLSNYLSEINLTEFADSVIDAANDDQLIAKQVYLLLLSDSAVELTDSALFVNAFDQDSFICKPFEYLNTDMNTYLLKDALLSNLSSVIVPFRRYFKDTVGVNIFTCPYPIQEQYNCKDFKLGHAVFIDRFADTAVPLVSNFEAIDFENPKQRQYANWMNNHLGLNLSFTDYYTFAFECENEGDTSYFGQPVNWTDSGKLAALKTALVSLDSIYFKDFTNGERFEKINATLLSNSIDSSSDYLGFGEIDLSNSHNDLFYLENQRLRYANLLDSLNWVYTTIRNPLHNHYDFEDTSLASCLRIDVAQYTLVPNTSNLLIDRVFRYSSGTVWVRLLNASDSSFYNDYYYHYEPYNEEYYLSDVDSFISIQPVFDTEAMHYVRLELDSIQGYLVASTAAKIAQANRLNQVCLSDYEGIGAYPFRQSCEDLKYFNAKINAEIKYKKYLEGVKDTFKINYVNHCLNRNNVGSAFTNQYLNMGYTSKEHQFTLYYYDQADNLVMTVPPGGVNQTYTYNSDTLQKIDAYRIGAVAEVLPTHKKQTIYKYNADNQVIRQTSPNGGTSYFWYDKAGRLVLSQNAAQKPANKYSYTQYDEQSRIFESGEVTLDELSGDSWEDIHAFIILEILDAIPLTLEDLIATKNRNNVVRTYYDQAILNAPTGFSQNNLRSRISTVATYDLYNSSTSNLDWKFASHYSYDATGNVKTLLNDYYQNGNINNEVHRYKRIDYRFDVVSGNVLQVYYQTGEADAFYHRYEYDAENRIGRVETSRDGILWDEDATYKYYPHGPLARMELGEHKIQGIDYGYTIEGWLKFINSGHKDADVGDDLKKTNVFGEDVFGMALQYHQNDYQSIGSMNDHLIAANSGDGLAELFNGNISAVTQHNQKMSYGKSYTYDQLNRLKSMGERSIDSANLKWGNHLTDGNSSLYWYDANGNITNLQRNDGESGILMDNLSYNYAQGSDRLSSIDETVPHYNFSNDIDDQSPNNYDYDEIGNLKKDVAEDIMQIQWYPNGKIKRIIRNNPSVVRPNLSFDYNPNGDRIKKKISFVGEDDLLYIRTTYYSRDAQGNVMAIYEERDCEYVQFNDSLGEYHYQYTGNFDYFTTEAVNQVGLDTLLNYLNGSFPLRTELLIEAEAILGEINGIRNLIISLLDVEDYLNLYPDAKSTLLNGDPYTYAHYLFNNHLLVFTALVNDQHEAYIEDHRVNGNINSFYNTTIDSSYTATYGSNTNANHYYLMNKDIVEDYFNDQGFLSALLQITPTDYNTLYGMTGGHPSSVNYPSALSTIQSWMADLQNQLVSLNTTSPTPELIDKINAAILMIDYTFSDVSTIFSGINVTTFYNALNWLPTAQKEKLNTVLYHFSFIHSGVVNEDSLLAYQPSAVFSWTQDGSGDLLNRFMHTIDANPIILSSLTNYLSSINVNDSSLYFDGFTTKQFALDALKRHVSNNTVTNALIQESTISQSLIDQTQSLSRLTHYFRVHHPKEALTQNYNHDLMNMALEGVNNITPEDYAHFLEDINGVDFGTLGGCDPHQPYMVAEQFVIFGSKRLGVMDAKMKRKDDDHVFSRKLGAKNYELSDHLGNVVATVSDKKLHPQEVLTNGQQNIDTTIGFQAEVTGRYDYYPYGMEIQSRSGSFTNIDYTKNLHRMKYDGLMEKCSSYSSIATKSCSTATNLYGQEYVVTVNFDPGNGSIFEFNIEVDLDKYLGQIETDKTYAIELHVDAQGRAITGPLYNYGVLKSESAGEDATSLEVKIATDKYLVLTYGGDDLENRAGSNGKYSINFEAGGAHASYPFTNDITVRAIKISEVITAESTPLSMQENKVYSYGFNGMERELGSTVRALPIYIESFNDTLVYHEDFSSVEPSNLCSGTTENVGGEDRLVVDYSSSVCGFQSNEFFSTTGDWYQWTVDRHQLNATQKIRLYWQFFDAVTETWKTQGVIETTSTGVRDTINRYIRPLGVRNRILIWATSDVLAGYVYDVKFQRQKNGHWTNGYNTLGDAMSVTENGRLRLQSNVSSQLEITHPASEWKIPVKHVGEEHTLSFDLERVTPDSAGIDYRLEIFLRESDGGGYSNIVGGSYHSHDVEAKEVTVNFIPTKKYIQLATMIVANTSPFPKPFEAYIDNILISDGKQRTLTSVSGLYTAQFWEYDARSGRRWNRDPRPVTSMSPYATFANNPIIMTDHYGDSAWSTVSGNTVTMHLTGKAIDGSSRNIDVQGAINSITEDLKSTYGGTFDMNGEEYNLEFDINITEAQSIYDVDKSDHLFVFADVTGEKNSARGASNLYGGVISYVNADDYSENGDLFNWNNTRTAVHEFGHLMNLEHPDGISYMFNIMRQTSLINGSFTDSEQRGKIYLNSFNNLNQGRPFITRGNNARYINDNITLPNGNTGRIGDVGISINRKKLKSF